MHRLNSKRFENIRAYGWAKKYDWCSAKSERYFRNFEGSIITFDGMWWNRYTDHGWETKFSNKYSLN